MEKLLETIEIETGKNPAASVIWMHGLGADGNDFVPIVNELDLDGAPGIRFVFPHAPMRAVTINNGMVMRAWYDIALGDLEGNPRRADERGVRESQAQITALIEREAKRGVEPEHIVLAGFSQGGAIALQTGLRHPRRLAGVMALSCYLPLAESLPREAAAANRTTPIFMAHGIYDPLIPIVAAAGSMTLLTGSGYAVEWRQYPMPHSVCPEEIQDIGAWLQKVLKA
ncbi:MAG TPA: alpha/beta hydrolase [Steroidobacteraceae bacterium]|nr:alpha/beta hydrolase [Steroidobacteraceae bacterium]